MPYAKNHIRVTVPRKSGFDKTHRNTGSLTCGTMTPILCAEVIPGTRVHLRVPIAVQLPPLASDTFMNLKLKAEAFFVPMRLLCGSFESWFSDFPSSALLIDSESETTGFRFSDDVKGVLPKLSISSDAPSSVYAPGSLLDYLGFRTYYDIGEENFPTINPMPLLAYHLVYQEWYRNPRVQKPCFAPLRANASSSVNADVPISACPSYFYTLDAGNSIPTYVANSDTLDSSYENVPGFVSPGSLVLADGISIFSLRQRNFGLDYFTGSRLTAQQGDISSVSIPVVSNTGTMTIAQLRAANSLQQFRERNNLPSPRMVDQVKARYGANLSDGVAQRPICIGSASYDISSTGVSQTAAAGEGGNNPFSGIAAQYGRAYASGNDIIIDDFTANEPGYILVNITLVPEATYSSGIDRMFRRYINVGSIVQMATPLLQNTGDQAIHCYEVAGNFDSQADDVFGYQDRYADFMFKMNSVHGLLCDGESLASFVLQRHFSSATSLSSSFLQIPKKYLDPVFAVSSEVSGLSAWYDAMLDYKVSMPLAEFSIPSLQDPAYEHGEHVVLRRNGQIF